MTFTEWRTSQGLERGTQPEGTVTTPWDEYNFGYDLGWKGEPAPADLHPWALRGYKDGLYDHENHNGYGLNSYPPMDEYGVPGW